MTLVRAKSGGWTDGDDFTAAEANHIDTEIIKAPDFAGGGDYSPSAPVNVGGSGIGIASGGFLQVLAGGQLRIIGTGVVGDGVSSGILQVASGGLVQVLSGSTLQIWSGATVELDTPVTTSGAGRVPDVVQLGDDASGTYYISNGSVILRRVDLTAPRTYTISDTGVRAGDRITVIYLGSPNALTVHCDALGSGTDFTLLRSTGGMHSVTLEYVDAGGGFSGWVMIGCAKYNDLP